MVKNSASSSTIPTDQSETGEAISSRDQLLMVAVDLVWNASYESVGVNEICKRAEVTKGCFYHHFNSKAELFYAASELYWQHMKPQLDSAVSPSMNGLEQLCYLEQMSISIQKEYGHDGNPVAGCPFLSTAAQIGHTEPLAAKAGREMTEHFLLYLNVIVENLLKQGYAENRMEPEQIARMMHQYYQGIMQYGRTYQSHDIVERDFADGMAQILGLKEEYIPQLRDAFRV